MPGVVGTNGSPDQTNWDAFWPKGMNLSEWDIFFENMDLDVPNTDTSTSGSSGPLFPDQSFLNTNTNNGAMEWDFGNVNFGMNGVP